ncbi:uncharacterized protein LOC112043272 [Bicyclus anynana]|uniref:Uncharacterized protein LOC112043272 n=1 Tax=Bicyclus anynana TaxID=110368 RepID=A0ABM3M7U3_BICAN|nr:uncharacterized protein LOC112043272 [Bicyclus anynana]
MKKFLLWMLFKLTYTLEVDKPDLIQNRNSQLGVRAVVIQCDVPEEEFPSDSDSLRFQREELFKHNALQDCKQKLAITIKMSSDPTVSTKKQTADNGNKFSSTSFIVNQQQASGDEYIPIEHVLGVNNKRIRLLNPYVLRLRRKTPYQAYKLKKIDVCSKVLQVMSRFDVRCRKMFIIVVCFQNRRYYIYKNYCVINFVFTYRKENTKTVHNNVCTETNVSLSKILRDKRHDIKDKDYEYNFERWTPTDLKPQTLHKHLHNNNKHPYTKVNEQSENILYEDREPIFDAADSDSDTDRDIVKKLPNENTEQRISKSYNNKDVSDFEIPGIAETKSSDMTNKVYKKNLEHHLKERYGDNNDKRDFVIYEIGDPTLWYSAQVQLYEKLSTPEGKIVWNDLTKDEKARVTSANAKWSNEDIHIQYKPTEFLAREDFALPVTDLCLVVSTKCDHENDSKDKISEFMIIPVDDVIELDDLKEINKRDSNKSDSNTVSKGSRRQVIVRTTRALMGGTTDNLKIVSRGADKYLKLPHSKPHYTQMDLEAKADDNERILVGAFGRLTTIVSDSTRRIRSILTVQATNTGLAAARMRVMARECSPDLLDSSPDRDETMAGPVIVPPKHTKTFVLKVPLQIPVENASCTIYYTFTVALVNDNGESVAVRDVRIKRDDWCYCVWHCDCVCLGEDPKLLCREMTAAQRSAAGLPVQQKSRHARSVCYPDVVSLNLLVICVGVFIVLLCLGLTKALMGLCCRYVASWGLYRFLDTPRKLDHYYERSLRNRCVVYDDEGWPVHPDTGERTVALVSEPMEFILNVIFFITLPCVMIWDAMRSCARCQEEDENSANYNNYKMTEDYNKCFSSHDVQITERRKRRRNRWLQRWMTPQAEELTSDLWHEGLSPLGKKTPVCMQPLLQQESGFRRTCEQSSFMDSEQDDTEYVLMQMQKSRESLVKSQRQLEMKTSAMQQMKGSSNAGMNR